MPCTPIITGDRFLTRALMHIDCQAQTVGTFGYQSLSEPGSLAAAFITGLLTLFIAVIGVRLLFGPPPGVRDVVFAALKVGVVITLAFSWPAFRTVIHDVVLDAPASVASRIVGPAESGGGTGLLAQLQAADDAILELTRSGTGRNTGALLDGQAPGGTFGSTALRDEEGYAWSRLMWLAGVIGSYGLLRLLAGLLLALAPLAAGLFLFEQTRGLFSGWIRGLVLALIGTIGATLVLVVELAAIGPWLADALRVRQRGYATPAAPTELFAMTLAFGAIQVGMLAVLCRVAFTRGWQTLALPFVSSRHDADIPALAPIAIRDAGRMPSRAEHLADVVELQLRRERQTPPERISYRTSGAQGARDTVGMNHGDIGTQAGRPRIGSANPRTARRNSRASNVRSAR
jgi:type IV secretion system protein VirB6